MESERRRIGEVLRSIQLDQILDCLASLGSRMDAYDGERKAKDEEGDSKMEDEIEKDKPRELGRFKKGFADGPQG